MSRPLAEAGVRIGCSGWQYRHWRGTFYPATVPQRQWFDYYAARFDTVEINNTFYRLPEPSTFESWKSRAPRGFLYAIKASRFLTHMKRLKDPKEPIDRISTTMQASRDAVRLREFVTRELARRRHQLVTPYPLKQDPTNL